MLAIATAMPTPSALNYSKTHHYPTRHLTVDMTLGLCEKINWTIENK